VFSKWSGTEVKIDDDEYLIVKESDVMGIWSRPMHARRPRDNAFQSLDRRMVSLKNECIGFL
jgi:hypothetical protein